MPSSPSRLPRTCCLGFLLRMARLARHGMVARHGYWRGSSIWPFSCLVAAWQRIGGWHCTGMPLAIGWHSVRPRHGPRMGRGHGARRGPRHGMALSKALAWRSAQQRHSAGSRVYSRWRLEARRRQPAAAWLLSPPAAASAAAWRSATPHRVARLSARLGIVAGSAFGAAWITVGSALSAAQHSGWLGAI